MYDIRGEGLEEVYTYISRRQNMDSHYIATIVIMDLFLESEKLWGAWVLKQCWDQEGLSLAVALDTAEVEGVKEADF